MRQMVSEYTILKQPVSELEYLKQFVAEVPSVLSHLPQAGIARERALRTARCKRAITDCPISSCRYSRHWDLAITDCQIGGGGSRLRTWAVALRQIVIYAFRTIALSY